MKRLSKDKVTATLYYIAGILFLINSIQNKNVVYAPLAFLYFVLAMRYTRNSRNKSNSKKEDNE